MNWIDEVSIKLKKENQNAIGYSIYDLTSIIYRNGIENCSEAVEMRKREYIDKLFYWKEHLCDYKGNWAAFMLR